MKKSLMSLMVVVLGIGVSVLSPAVASANPNTVDTNMAYQTITRRAGTPVAAPAGSGYRCFTTGGQAWVKYSAGFPKWITLYTTQWCSKNGVVVMGTKPWCSWGGGIMAVIKQNDQVCSIWGGSAGYPTRNVKFNWQFEYGIAWFHVYNVVNVNLNFNADGTWSGRWSANGG